MLVDGGCLMWVS